MGETSTFSFGNFIKILFPGLALSTAIYVFVLSGQWFQQNTAEQASTASLIDISSIIELLALVIVPLSVFFGLIINAVVFVLLNRLLVRLPHRLLSRDYYEKAGDINNMIRQRFSAEVCPDLSDKERLELNNYLDPELLLLNGIQRENLKYVQEKYFLYHEVQMNMIAATILFFPIFAWAEIFGFTKGAFIQIGWFLTAFASILFVSIMWWAAYTNYDRYLKKTLSLRLSALYAARTA